MSLQLILGNSGAGKSYELYQSIIRQSIENPDKNYIVLVPEQFTMQTQKDLVSLHPNKGIMNIDILSFGRLAFRVFEEVGGDNRLVLDDMGKNLVIRKIAGEVQDNLKILGGNLKKIGYISEMKSIISELTQYNISTEQLEKMIKVTEGKPQLNYKLQDISVLYQAFERYLQDKYITAEEILAALCQVIDKSEMIKNCVIALDGFTGFTPIQNELLSHLLKLTDKIYVTVTIDAKEDPLKMDGEHKLFHLSKKTIYGLCKLAMDAKVDIDEPVVLGKRERYRFKDAKALDFLEQNLFRYSGKVFREKQDSIRIHLGKNPVEEIRFVSSTIKTLIREKQYRYKDFAVVTGDMGTYSSYIEKIFGEYEIPGFIDNKRSILFNPFVDFIRAAIDMVVLNYSYESVFRFLRCNLSVLEKEEVDVLENYVIALGIRGFHKWNQKWIRLYKGMKEEEIDAINQMREKFIGEVTPFTLEVKRKGVNVRDITKALYGLIVTSGMQLKLKKYEEYFHARGELSLEREYAQIYRIIMELLDKIVELLGDEKLPVREYAQILDAGFEEAKVGIIPPSVDQVVVGDIERTRLKDVKVLFFVGINDGIIPKSGNNGGIISDLEREILIKEDIELAPTSRQNAYIQKLYLYLNITKPSERLYLTFSKVNTEGKTLRPSYLIGNISKLFEQIEIIDEEENTDFIDQISTYKSGLPYLIEGFHLLEENEFKTGAHQEKWKELYSCYFENEEYKDIINNLVDAAFYAHKEEKLSKAVAKALYGNTLENSVTRLEKYTACAFAHFLSYGLHLSEREVYEFEPVDMGTVFHDSLEAFSKKLEKNGFTWFDVPEDRRNELMDDSVEDAITDFHNTVLHSSPRNEYTIERMKRIMRRTVWALHEQVKKGTFTPSRYEVSFHMVEDLESIQINLSDDEKLKLHGRIDRLDTYEEEDKVYVKIIDYKSGETDFDMVALYHGLQLQLVVYLNAAMEMEQKSHKGKEVVPAGIFYYNVKDPMTDREEQDNEETINGRILKDLRMKGLVNDDSHIIHQLDKEIGKTSNVIPVGFNTNGSLSKNSNVASTKQFELLSDYVNGKIVEIGKEILDGNIQVKPYELDDKNACEYCPYSGVCGFDKKTPGFSYKRLAKYKKEDIWDKLAEAGVDKERSK